MTRKILIVDDSKLARMAAAKALNTLHPDWTRLEATNTDEALALAKAHDVDVALLDFNMPGRDGLSLAAELRAINASIVLAVVSANLQEEIVSRARAVGAGFLPKPITAQALDEFLSGTALRTTGVL